MKNYMLVLAIASYIYMTECYINIPQLPLKKNKNSMVLKAKNQKSCLDSNQKFIYKNYLLSVRKVQRTIKNSNSAVDINYLIDTLLNIVGNNTSDAEKSVLYLKNNNTIIDNNDLIAKNLILSNIHIDVSNIKVIQISTKNDTLVVNLDKNNNNNNDYVKYELGKIDALLNVASIITTLLNN